MTYNEINTFVHGGGWERMSEREAKLNRLDRIAWRIHSDLHGRSGHDHWWDGINSDIQDEIFEAIKHIVAEETAA